MVWKKRGHVPLEDAGFVFGPKLIARIGKPPEPVRDKDGWLNL
jgi:hypothetical protein